MEKLGKMKLFCNKPGSEGHMIIIMIMKYTTLTSAMSAHKKDFRTKS